MPLGWGYDLDLLAPGVRGYAIENDGLIYIPLINAETEGAGDVGRFLDSLSPRCLIVNVTSRRLKGMLERRGWTCKMEITQDGPVDLWSKNSRPEDFSEHES